MINNTAPFLATLKQQDVRFVDFRFTDMKGTWHHMTYPASAVTSDLLKEGVYFDRSSISGWCRINKSDMVLVPDLKNATLDPFAAQTTIMVICNVKDPKDGKLYDRDPRTIAQKAEAYLKDSGIGDTAYFGPEPEFFVFDNVRFASSSYDSFFELDSDEFPESGRKDFEEGNHGHRPAIKGGYLPVPPLDSMSDLRAQMLTHLTEMGVTVEKHHHEVAPAQHELAIHFSSLTEMADQVQIYKYVVRNVAHSYGKTATFMPKPVLGDNGSGMHVHQSLWNKGKTLFAGKGYAGLSDTALYYIGGILRHAKALNAFTNPTTNSYKRLVPGFEAPVILTYSERNRSAACRIPLGAGENGKRVEVRFPDPTANAYLAFSAMLLAGLDGIKNKIHPGQAMDVDLFEDKKSAQGLANVCGSLREALEALVKDQGFLLAGNVFSQDFIDAYLDLKWKEVHVFEQAPHPIEFKMYYSS